MPEIKELYSLFKQYPQICTDTRDISEGSLFFALKGENFNANKFAAEALEKGSKFAIIDEKEFKKGSQYILVNDVLKTLQQLASFHRNQLKIPVLGITGTNGKTTTKELINAVLSKKYSVHSTKGNFNNHIGVPLTILSIKDDVEFAVIEMGANHPGEIGELCSISRPDYGVITNIGKAHLEGFGSIEGVVNTKRELYDFIVSVNGKVFVCIDNGLLMELSEGMQRITYGVFPNSDYKGEILESNPFLNFKWHCKSLQQELRISTNLIGYFNFENVLAAVSIGDYFGVKPLDIKNAIENYKPTNNRSQHIVTKKNTLFMDAYNANPTSMDAAIRNFSQINCSNKFAIIGDMRELGIEAEQEHQKILELLENSDFDKILLVGKVFTSLNKSSAIPAFENVSEAKVWLKNLNPEGFNILIKGSRGIKLENLLECL